VHITLNSTPSSPAKRVVLFHRDFRTFSGGHLKMWDYFNHVAASGRFEPRIAFSAESKWDATNPWYSSLDTVVPWDPTKADVLFLAGTDWRALPPEQRNNSPRPIFNLIQHPRHAVAGSELREFLKHRAIRICVSEEVAAAIKETNEVNGPVFVIPNGIDITSLPRGRAVEDRTTDLLICGLKAPELARESYTTFAVPNRVVRWLIEWIPRNDYLKRVADARITLFLPRPSEGFYLPPLEGMACGTIVVCPDCVGNRGFCVDLVNCFRPEYNESSIRSAVTNALQQNAADRARMQKAAHATAARHSLESERASFLNLLDRVDELWAQ
jgi:hypothetical protein